MLRDLYSGRWFILLTVLLSDTDLKIIQHSVLLKLNGSFGLDELDS